MSQATRGQRNRQEVSHDIELNLQKYCPNTLDKMANLIAYDYNLSPYTVRYTYLPMYVDVGRLVNCGNGCYDVWSKLTKDDFSESELQAELDEENKNRKQLGKPELTMEQWKKERPPRFKQLS